MIACHISFVQGEPLLWFEQGSRDANGSRSSSASVHTFAPSKDVVAAALAMLEGKLQPGKRKALRLSAWLPACKGRVIPSSPLLGVIPDSPADALLPVNVMAYRLNYDELRDIAHALLETSDGMPGLLSTASLRWADAVLRLAVAMVTGQRVLPGMAMMNKRWASRWLPMANQDDKAAIAGLEESMPASSRCLTEKDLPAPDQTTGAVMHAALETAVDYCARWSSLARGPMGSTKKLPTRNLDSMHDAWLLSLRIGVSVVAWKEQDELGEFAKQLVAWRRPVEILMASPFRLGFRLVEPERPPDDAGAAAIETLWTLEYFMSPKDDPSLVIPLEEVWKRNGDAAERLRQYNADYMEYTLMALGQAAGLIPAVARSLQRPQPCHADIDTNEAYLLLRETAAMLRNAGFLLLLPAWWTGKGVKRISVHARMKRDDTGGPGVFSMNSLVGFDLHAALGDDTLNLAELRRLAKLKSTLVYMRGEWVEVDPKALAAAIHALESGKDLTMSARDALALGLGAARKVNGVVVESAELSGWLKDILIALQNPSSFAEQDAPSAFNGVLRPYQKRGYSWLAMLSKLGLGACLADDMGLGKTVQTLAHIQRLRAAGERDPVLLVCPTTVINNWRKEAERFSPDLKVMLHHGNERHRKGAFKKAAGGSAVVLTSYGLLHRDQETFASLQWAGIVLDEAQNIKNSETKQSKAARALHAKWRVALTGTPVENSVADLWSIMEYLNPGWLGNKTSFRELFTMPIQRYGDAYATAQLKKLTGPFILRRMKTDKTIITDLPDKIVQKEFCTLTREQATLYQAVIDSLSDTLDGSEGIQRKGEMLAALTRLKQICNHPAHYLADGSALERRSGKLSRLVDILVETRSRGESTLVFSQFAEMGALLRKALEQRFGEEVLFLHGGVPRKRRDGMVERFQNGHDAPKVFILSLKAGGTGLTLTNANHVVHYDRWWNPAVEEQATDRAFRIGQKKNVQVHTFVVAGTLEERIDELIEKKQDMAERIVGSGEQWLTELSNRDFLELISLSPEAVGDDA
jgi:SNF2 family DNA or RNA helicase